MHKEKIINSLRSLKRDASGLSYEELYATDTYNDAIDEAIGLIEKSEDYPAVELLREFLLCRRVDVTMQGPIPTGSWDASRLFRLWDKVSKEFSA